MSYFHVKCMNSIFLLIVADITLQSDEAIPYNECYFIVSFPNYLPFRSHITSVPNNALLVPFKESLTYKHFDYDYNTLDNLYLRIELRGLNGTEQEECLGDVQVSLSTLFLGPQNNVCYLSHCDVNMHYYVAFKCLALEYSNLLFKPDTIVIDNLDVEQIKLYFEIQNLSHESCESDIITTSQTDSNSVWTAQTDYLPSLNGSICFQDIISNPILKISLINVSTSESLGDYYLNIVDEYPELIIQDCFKYYESDENGETIETPTYNFELHGSITGFPKYLQCFKGTHTYKDGQHQFTSIQIADIMNENISSNNNNNELNIRNKNNKLSIFEPLCLPPNSMLTNTKYPVKIGITIKDIECIISQEDVPQNCSVMFYISNDSNSSITTGLKSLEMCDKKTGTFTTNGKAIKLPLINSFTPYLFTNQYLNIEVYNNNEGEYCYGNYQISLHNLFSGPVSYSCQLNSYHENEYVRINFNSEILIKKKICGRLSDLKISNIVNGDFDGFIIEANMNCEKVEYNAYQSDIKNKSIQFMSEDKEIDLEYDSNGDVFDDDNKKNVFSIRILKDEKIFADYKIPLSQLIPFVEDKDVKVTLKTNSNKIKNIVLSYHLHFYSNVDGNGIYTDYCPLQNCLFNDGYIEYDEKTYNEENPVDTYLQQTHLSFKPSYDSENNTTILTSDKVNQIIGDIIWSNNNNNNNEISSKFDGVVSLSLEVDDESLFISSYDAENEDNNKLLLSIPFQQIVSGWTPNTLRIYSKKMSFLMSITNNENPETLCTYMNQIKQQMKPIKGDEDEEESENDEVIPKENMPKNLYNSLLNDNTSIMPCRTPPALNIKKAGLPLDTNRYVLACPCQAKDQLHYLAITCPLCSYHPDPKQLYVVCEVSCQICSFYRMFIWKDNNVRSDDDSEMYDDIQVPEDTPRCYCGTELPYSDFKQRKAWKCLSCGTMTNATCKRVRKSREMYDPHIMYVVKCRACDKMNIVEANTEVCCKECHTALPPISYPL